VSQEAVERTIGKLVTDAQFRARFFPNPAAATWEAGLLLSRVELEALSALSLSAVSRFGQGLDPRISRLCLDGPTSRRGRERARGDDTATERAT
jgi:hypothetical protein